MVDTGVSLNLENYQEPNELESLCAKRATLEPALGASGYGAGGLHLQTALRAVPNVASSRAEASATSAWQRWEYELRRAADTFPAIMGLAGVTEKTERLTWTSQQRARSEHNSKEACFLEFFLFCCPSGGRASSVCQSELPFCFAASSHPMCLFSVFLSIVQCACCLHNT